MKHFSLIFSLVFFSFLLTQAQVEYPYPVQKMAFTIEGQAVQMAFMDIKSEKPSGKTILLLHGKNFNGYYWKNVVPFLTRAGYRVIVPDQLGWGESSRANIHYSFHLLAANTKKLLDTLGISQTVVLGHSMGGMLATRFSLMYPQVVEKLILENPIGLEDYKTFVPYQPLSKLVAKEAAATYESYKKYQQSYYPVWKPEYEQYVQAQAADLSRKDVDSIALVNALTYQLIYEQPVCYEFNRLKMPALLIIGAADRTVVGKDQLTEAQKKIYGQYPSLARKTQQAIKGSQLKLLPGVGHIPHVQAPEAFEKIVLHFLGNN
ncbi:MAG: alpha/beta hydrolase [Ferruginibacter sp.]|nr:alpha/beta hydrolase [Ferruginibacter sp.]